jgi:hypothetical protein
MEDRVGYRAIAPCSGSSLGKCRVEVKEAGSYPEGKLVETAQLEMNADHTGRSERIRTSDPCFPKAVLYQAELHSERHKGTAP